MIRLFHSEDPRVVTRRVIICLSASVASAWTAATTLFSLAVSFSGSLTWTAVVASAYLVAVVIIGAGIGLTLLSRMTGQQKEYTRALRSFLIIPLWAVPAAMFSLLGGFIGICIVGAFASVLAGFFKAVSGSVPGADVERSSQRSDTHLAQLAGLICLAYSGIAAELGGSRKVALRVPY